MESISVPYVISYWNGLVSDIPWKKVWSLPHKYLITNKMREIAFKLIHRIYPDKCSLKRLKGIVHFEIKIWYLSAYPKGIQDVDVFFSSVDPIWMFLGQNVLVCQSYNGRYRLLSL